MPAVTETTSDLTPGDSVSSTYHQHHQSGRVVKNADRLNLRKQPSLLGCTTLTHTHIHTHTRTHARTHARTHRRTAHSHWYSQSLSLTHTHTHARTLTDTHWYSTLTHTHTRIHKAAKHTNYWHPYQVPTSLKILFHERHLDSTRISCFNRNICKIYIIPIMFNLSIFF